jgi:uncharacterized protein (UPF0335 family)
MQKAMEFILQQQAQSSVKIDALSEAQKESQKAAEERWKRSDARWEQTEQGIRALLSIAEIHEREIASLGEKIAEVSDNGRATDERLNALINTVERQISEVATANLERKQIYDNPAKGCPHSSARPNSRAIQPANSKRSHCSHL